MEEKSNNEGYDTTIWFDTCESKVNIKSCLGSKLE